MVVVGNACCTWDQHLAQLTDELARNSALLKQAKVNAVEVTKRAGLELRKQADQLLAQTSRVERKDVEFVKMRAKLDKLLLSCDQHVHALEKQNWQFETELADVPSRRQVFASLSLSLGAKEGDVEGVVIVEGYSLLDRKSVV